MAQGEYESDDIFAGHPDEYLHLIYYDPEMLDYSMKVVRDAIETEIHFEPFRQVGDVDELLNAAANLLRFVEEYERRVGSTELPSSQ